MTRILPARVEDFVAPVPRRVLVRKPQSGEEGAERDGDSRQRRIHHVEGVSTPIQPFHARSQVRRFVGGLAEDPVSRDDAGGGDDREQRGDDGENRLPRRIALSHAIETRYAGSPAGSTTAITAIVWSRLSAQVDGVPLSGGVSGGKSQREQIWYDPRLFGPVRQPQAVLNGTPGLRKGGSRHRSGAILLERLLALAPEIVNTPEIDVRPRHQTQVARHLERLLEVFLRQVGLARVAGDDRHTVKRAGTPRILRQHAFEDVVRFLVVALRDKVVTLVDEAILRRLRRTGVARRGLRRGRELYLRHLLGYIIGVNAQNQRLVVDAHRGFLFLVLGEGVVEVGREDQALRRQVLRGLFRFRLGALVHAELDGPNQALREQEGKIRLEVGSQRGGVVRHGQELGLLLNLGRILERQRIEHEVEILVPNLGYLEFLGRRDHQVVVGAVDARLHLVGRGEQAEIDVVVPPQVGAARRAQVDVRKRHALAHRVAVTRDFRLIARLDARPQLDKVRLLVELLE